ncbi:MAG: hypothetical protein JST73_12530 [Actinobacteria bacterium]|nr:hypothetical protein [Actinomycetota bacterium]
MSVAQQLAVWNRVPLVYWPPGYPLFVAGAMKPGLSALAAARAVAVVGAAATAFLGYVGARRLFGLAGLVSAAIAVLCVVLIGIRPEGVGPLPIWAYAMSESVYVPVVSATVLVGISLSRRPSRFRLVGVIIGVAVATLVRAGGPVIGFAIACGLLARARRGAPGSRRADLVRAGCVAATGVIVAVGWSAWNRARHTGTAPIRTVAWHGFGDSPSILARTCAGWFGVPSTVGLPIAVVVAVAFVAVPVFVGLWRPARDRVCRSRRSLALSWMVSSAAIALIVVSVLATRLILDPTSDPDSRLLVSAQPLAYLLLASILSAVVSSARRADRLRRPAVLFGVAVFAVVAVLPALVELPAGRTHHDRSLTGTMVYGRLTRATPSILFVTNTPDRLWLDTGRSSIVLPWKRFIMTGRSNPHFDADISAIGRLARNRPTAVVMTPDVHGWNEPATHALVAREGFRFAGNCGPAVRVWVLPRSAAADEIHRICR